MSVATQSDVFSVAHLVDLAKKVGLENVRGILDGTLLVKIEPAPLWRREGDLICFEVTSDGTTGPEWIAFFEGQRQAVGSYAQSVLRSSDFVPTKGVKYKVVVLPGRLYADNKRVTQHIRANAADRKLLTPHPEVACLTRKLFSNAVIEEMGLYAIIAMHDPIKDSDGDLSLLGTSRDGCDLYAYYVGPDYEWSHDNGFAFVASQAS